MKARRSLPPLLAALGLLLTPSIGVGESVWAAQGQNANASLDFRIVIPPVMRVLENSHPVQLDAQADGARSAEQRLVVLSNMKHGFCVTLRQADPQLSGWRLQAAQAGGVSLSAVAEGYRLCTSRPGRYTLLLQHQFDTSENTAALRWPVRTDLTAL